MYLSFYNCPKKFPKAQLLFVREKAKPIFEIFHQQILHDHTNLRTILPASNTQRSLKRQQQCAE